MVVGEVTPRACACAPHTLPALTPLIYVHPCTFLYELTSYRKCHRALSFEKFCKAHNAAEHFFWQSMWSLSGADVDARAECCRRWGWAIPNAAAIAVRCVWGRGRGRVGGREMYTRNPKTVALTLGT